METWKSFFNQLTPKRVDFSDLVELMKNTPLTFISEKHNLLDNLASDLTNELTILRKCDQEVQLGLEDLDLDCLSKYLVKDKFSITNGITQGKLESYFDFLDRYENKMSELILKALTTEKKTVIIAGEDHLRPSSGIPYRNEIPPKIGLVSVPKIIIYQKTDIKNPHIMRLKDGIYQLIGNEHSSQYKEANLFLIKGILT